MSLDFNDVTALAELLKPMLPETKEANAYAPAKSASKILVGQECLHKEENEDIECDYERKLEEFMASDPKYAVTTSFDFRKDADFSIFYREKLSPEDIYLPISLPKCSNEEMVIEVRLPSEDINAVDLQMSPLRLRLWSHLYKLDLSLPKQVLEREGVAKWDPLNCILKIFLPVDQRARRIL